MAKLKFEARADEKVFAQKVTADCWASPKQVAGQISGKMYFTDKRIVFLATGLIGTESVSWEIEMGDISLVKGCLKPMCFPMGVLIKTKDGSKYVLAMWKRKKYIDWISQHINQTGVSAGVSGQAASAASAGVPNSGGNFLPAGIERLQAGGDWAGLAKTYFDAGMKYWESGDFSRACLWLGRCQAVTDSNDRIYEKVGDEIINKCSNIMHELEDAPTLTNQTIQRIEREFDTLSGGSQWLWGFFTLCRMEKLLTRAGRLAGCAPLADTGRIIDCILKGEWDDEACDRLEAYNDFLAGWADTPAYLDLRQQIPVQGRAAFQLLDMNGEIAPTEMNLYFDLFVNGELDVEDLKNVAPMAVLEKLDLNDNSGMVRCAMLSDYWLRTSAGRLEDIPQVQAEQKRIWDDLEFLRKKPSLDAILERVEMYRGLDILA